MEKGTSKDVTRVFRMIDADDQMNISNFCRTCFGREYKDLLILMQHLFIVIVLRDIALKQGILLLIILDLIIDGLMHVLEVDGTTRNMGIVKKEKSTK